MNSIDDPIVMEIKLPVPMSQVWSALTNLKEMQQWYFPQLTAFEAKVGFETHFEIEHEGRVFPHNWKITKVDAPKLIEYEWTFDGYTGVGLTTFTLREEGEHTVLHLNNPTLKPFPAEIPEFKRESGVEGWNYLLKTSLKEYLEG